MSKLWLIGLAASAAWTPAAMAQHAPPPPPPPPMAHGAHAPGGHNGHGAMVGHSGGHGAMRGGHHQMKGMKGMPGAGHMKGMRNWQRFGRGHVVPPHFRAPRFFVHDWRTFGWPAPMPGGNWIRYHDDALLVDGHGRVVDGRYGWDWDGHGGGMAYDDGGYDNGHGYGEEEYADGRDYEEEGLDRGHHGRGDRVVRVYRRGDRGDCGSGCGGPGYMPPPPAYGYGGYGYSAGCACGPVVITETTTTTAPVVETRTYYETVYEHRAAPRRHYKKKAVRHYSKPVVRRSVKPAYRAPAPRPGERG